MLINKSIIIVSDGKKEMKKLAHHLYNIIGSVSDCDAAIWDEKHYKDNEPTLPASQMVIFVGETNTSKMLIDSINWKYDELNMRIGWIGRRAVVYVQRKNLSILEYDEFKAKFLEQENEIKSGGMFEKLKRLDMHITKANTKAKVVGLLLPYVWPVAGYALIKGKIDSNKIIKQQYSFALNKFIDDHLPAFIGGDK